MVLVRPVESIWSPLPVTQPEPESQIIFQQFWVFSNDLKRGPLRFFSERPSFTFFNLFPSWHFQFIQDLKKKPEGMELNTFLKHRLIFFGPTELPFFKLCPGHQSAFRLRVDVEVRMLSNFESDPVLLSFHFSTQAELKLSRAANGAAIRDKTERRVRTQTWKEAFKRSFTAESSISVRLWMDALRLAFEQADKTVYPMSSLLNWGMRFKILVWGVALFAFP